jgi:hypothetical protein
MKVVIEVYLLSTFRSGDVWEDEDEGKDGHEVGDDDGGYVHLAWGGKVLVDDNSQVNRRVLVGLKGTHANM